MAAEARPGARRGRDAAADPGSPALLALRQRPRPSSRTRPRRSASTRTPAAGRPTCSSASTCRRGCSRRSSSPGTRLGPLAAAVAEETGSASAAVVAVATHDTALGRRGDAVPADRLRRSSARARGRSSASRFGRPSITDARVRGEPDQRGRRRRHLPPAAQRHRALAAPRVPPRLGRGGTRALVRPARRARGGRAGAAVVHRPERRASSSSPATCRRASGRSARETGQPEPVGSRRGRPLHPREPRAEARARRSTCSRPSPARRRRRSTSSAAARATSCSAAGRPTRPGFPSSPAPRRRRCSGTCSCRRWRSARSGRSPRARELDARLGRADRLRAAGSTPSGRRRSERFAGAVASCRRWRSARERVDRRTARDPRAGGPVGRRGRARARRARGARLPVEPARRRSGAREQRRRQHLGEGNDRRPRRPRAARALGQGLGHRPRDDHRGRLRRRCASTRCCRCATASRWTTRRWSSTSCAAALDAEPAAAVDRDAAARVRRRRRTSTTRTRTRSSR